MALVEYRKKRNFNKTAEPKGKEKETSPGLIFVVQQHAASHLHYDFRLEMEGVLKSWAVPKGPSLNPDDKRLAMMVEDHPYDYKDFEGTIPEGNYGAGNVIVWDNGTYEPVEGEGEKALLAGLKKGHISFILKGKKLKGEFSLVKLSGAKQPNAWLLIKKKDKYASEEDVLKKNRSVKSKKTLNGIAKKVAGKESPQVPRKKKAPEKIKPMLAEITQKAFNDKDWLFELKYDGYRALAIVNNGSVELYSRNLLPFNQSYPTVVSELKKITHSALLDGEVVIEDEHGRSRFQLLQNFKTTRKGVIKYYVFDLLNLNGYDTTAVPLLERKKLLKTLLEQFKLKNIYYSDHIIEHGTEFFKMASGKLQEGIMAKLIDSPYRPGRRSTEWLKIRLSHQQEAVIIGFTAPSGQRKHFGSLLLALWDGGKWRYIGNCGTGFNEGALRQLYQKFRPLFSTKSPLEEQIPEKDVQWLKPKLVCQVKFSEWTDGKHLRHPVFLGLREDKSPKEATPEKVLTTH